MKTPTLAAGLRLLTLVACLLFVPGVRAGLTFNIDAYRGNEGTFYNFYTPLSTNTTPPDAAVGMYFINSPQWPASGSTRQYQITTNGLNPNPINGQETGYSDYWSMMQQITNGTWTILFTNATTTNLYTFKVSAPAMTSNMLPLTLITFPANGTLNVPNQPNFTWEGPTNLPLNNPFPYIGNYDFSFFEYITLPSTQTNWTPSTPMPNGMDGFLDVDYLTNYTSPVFVATTPLSTNNSQPISGWMSTSTLETGDYVNFAVTNPPPASLTLVAHYTFANSGNLGQDSSGNGYNLDFNGGDGVTFSSTAVAGGGAAYFDGGSFFSYSSTPSYVLSTLAGDFSLSFWIETTQNDGNEYGEAYAGAGIVAADIPGSAYDLVPAALDGGEIGFNTGPYDDTLNSQTDINDGNYHHVVITRDQATGVKQVYIDGVLDNSDTATLNPLSDPRMIAIGCQIDASQTDPNNANPNNYFQGLLDDVQLYAGVLSSSQVAALYASPGSTATGSGGSGGGSSGGHTLIAHYTFDNSGYSGQDSSPNGNNIDCGSGWGSNDVFSTDAVAGGGAREFFGGSSLTPCDSSQTFTSWTNTLAGSFSVSAWIATTNVVGNDGDDLGDYNGQSVVYADNNNLGATPMALTGTKIAFRTTDPDGNDDTLHSMQSVTTGNYVHVVTTRDQTTGEKKIYINGVIDNSDIASTESLTGDQYNSIGGELFSPYSGLVDDVQIYAGVLSADDVAYLYNNPGMTVTNASGGTGSDFNTALGTTNLGWSTSGDTSWFIETTNTYNGAPSAAQSGIVTNEQSSTISVTVTGPGTLTFYWSSQDTGGNFDYEFDMDGSYEDDIYYDTAWYQDGPFTIPAGQHTLTWTTYAYGDDGPTEAGFLDDVSFGPETIPIITLNPFSQTNYPGYPVWLSANATTNDSVSWQWYEVSSGAISGATSPYYIPTNSGTPGVVGSYYAVASNDAGSANTTTAAVTFVTAPLPPNWSIAFKSPFEPQDESQEHSDEYFGCCTDTNGNIYTAAEFGGNVQVGAINLESGTGGDAAAIVKQTPSGSPLWAVGITNNGSGSANAYDVAPGPNGGAYLAGDYSGNDWLGTNQLTDNGNGNIFLAAFNASGSNLWVKSFGGTNSDFILINSLASDPAGNVTLCGLLGSGPVTIGSSNYMVSGQEGLIVQLDQTGAVRWAQLLPEFPQYVTYGTGRLYVSINTTVTGGTTNATIGGVTNITDRSWAVASLNDTNGHAIWVKGVGAQSGDDFSDPYFANLIDDVPRLAVSGTNLFITGVAYASTASFGALTVNFGDLRGEYFARYNTNGIAQVATTYGSITTTPDAAVANAQGDLYVSGVFDADSFFGNPLIAAPVETRPYSGDFSQAFLAKFDMNGNPLWADEAVSAATVNFGGIALASNGVWASGWCLSGNYPQVEYTQFGTNNVYSSAQYLEGGEGGGVIVVWYPAGVLAKVTDTGAQPTAVTLINPEKSGANFQFQFLSEAGFSHNILYRTNLQTGNWQTNSTIMGDGTIKTVSLPMSLFSPSHQGYIEVSTQ